ncbi:hypothetical protein FI667_g3164, partial [Globisporangium splendens]
MFMCVWCLEKRSDITRPKSAVRDSRPPSGQSIRPRENTTPACSAAEATATADTYSNSEDDLSSGRRLRDGGYVCDSEQKVDSQLVQERDTQTKQVAKKLPSLALLAAQKRIHGQHQQQNSRAEISTVTMASSVDSTVLAKTILHAQAAFTTPGHLLGGQSHTRDAMLGGQVERVETRLPSDPAAASTPKNDPKLPRQSEPAPERNESSVVSCRLCLADVSAANLEMHTLRCAKNPSYHKMQCVICQEKILLSKKNEYLHCRECDFLASSSGILLQHNQETRRASHKCDSCGKMFTRDGFMHHVEAECDHVLSSCTLCGFKFKRNEIEAHIRMCSSRTAHCGICQKYINIVDLEWHADGCGGVDEVASRTTGHQGKASTPSASNQDDASQMDSTTFRHSVQPSLECVYCSKKGFQNAAEVELHARIACRIAKAFTTTPLAVSSSTTAGPVSRSSQDEGFLSSQDIGSVRSFVQCRIRRKGDASALHNATRALLAEMDHKYSVPHIPETKNNNDNDGDARNSNAVRSVVNAKKAKKMPPPQVNAKPLALLIGSKASASKLPALTSSASSADAIALSIASTSLLSETRSMTRQSSGVGRRVIRRGVNGAPRQLDKFQESKHGSSSSTLT